jgi:transcription elongation GreA/GreB family factor
MYIAKELNQFEQVDQLLDKIPQGVLSPTALQILGVRLAIARDQQKEANELADQALKILPEDAPADDRRNLAMILCQLSRFDEALPIWQQIAPLNIFGNDTRYLLACAMRAERHGVVLDVCRTLRAAGIEDSELFETEMFVLERYAPAEALERLREEMLKRPDDRLLRLRLSILGLRLNRPDFVVSDVGQLPLPSEVSPRDAVFAVAVLRSRGNPDDAVKYAYEVLRLHFNDIDAHRAYVSSMAPGEHRPSIATCETVVSIGCAVRFVAERSSEEQWTIIEDCADPDPSRHEISPGSALAKELLGKRIEDSFEISPFARGVIREITSKFVFRYQDCFKQWQFRFSDKPEILSFHVGMTGTFESDFEPIVTMMRTRRERIQEVERLYTTHAVPIHIVAKALNMNDFVALAGLANSPDVLIRCCDGSALERATAQKILDDRSRIVLDMTAISSLILLDRLDLLETISFTVIVASGTVAVLEEMLRDEQSNQEHLVGFLGDADGRPQFTEITEQEKQRRVKELRQLLETIKNRCEVRYCGQLAYLAPEKRMELIELFGQHGGESIVLASESGSALWTDDLTVAAYARELSGVPRIWTHLVLQYLRQQGSLDEAGYLSATARLAGWGYFFTSINAGAVVAAGRLGGWNPDKWPLKQSLSYLRVETVPIAEVVNLTSHLIVQVYREGLLPERKSALMIAILENLGRRERGLEAITAIRRILPKTFGLDVVGAHDAARTIDAWHAAKKR